MSFVLLRHNLGYLPHREEVKNIIQIDSNITTARTILNNLIVEHDTLKNSITNNDDLTINTDNHALHHAALHLEHADLELNQKQATINALDEKVTDI